MSLPFVLDNLLNFGAGLAVMIWAATFVPSLIRSFGAGSRLSHGFSVATVFLACFLATALDPTFSRGLTLSQNTAAGLASAGTQVAIWMVGAVLVLVAMQSALRPSAVGLALVSLWIVLLFSSVVQGQDAWKVLQPIVLVLAASVVRVEPQAVVIAFRWGFRAIIGASLALWLADPTLATWISDRTIFGVPQLAGITTHPNVLGPLAAVGLIAEIGFFRSKVPNLLAVLAATVTVVLAQSRAGWAMAVVGIAILWAGSARGRERRLARGALVGVTSVGAVLAVFGDSASGADVTSGRFTNWGILFGYFLRSPVIGNGIDVLDTANRADLGRFASAVGQAHNQFVQTMIDSGIVGLVPLVVLTAVVVVTLVRTRSDIAPLAVAVSVALALLSMSETPLRPVLGGGLPVTLFMVALLSSMSSRPDHQVPGRDFRRTVRKSRRGTEPSAKYWSSPSFTDG